MSTMHNCHAAAAASEMPARAGTVTDALAAAWRLPRLWAKRIRERRELGRLLGQPDYIIKDIGLQRGDITRESLKPFWMG
jgi:uncharacterized protein YjiS (DUF1127 family)